MSTLNRIFGWSPPKNQESVRVPQRPAHPALHVLTFQTQRIGEAENPTCPDKPSSTKLEAPSPASSISSELPQDAGPKRGDPSWVARPRNPFIIFRCEYSQKHCKEGKRVRRPPGAPLEKSLSKRAAEAWKELSDEAKSHYKDLAKQEQEEHTRLYPHYRFRPAKRNLPTRRSSHYSSSKPHHEPLAPPLVKHEPELASPVPKHPPAPEVLEEQAEAAAASSVKGTRRRSSSMPQPMKHNVYLASMWEPQPPIPEIVRRPRSANGSWPSTLDQMSQSILDGCHYSEGSDLSPSVYTPVSCSSPHESFSPLTGHLSALSLPLSSPLAMSPPHLGQWPGEVDGSQHGSCSQSAASSPWMPMSALSLGSPPEHPQDYFSPLTNEMREYFSPHYEHQDYTPVSLFNLTTFAPLLPDGMLYPPGDGEGSPYVGPEPSYPPEAYDYGFYEPANDQNAQAEVPSDDMSSSQPRTDSYFYAF